MAEKITQGLIKQQQMEHFTLDRVQEAFDDRSIPEEKVILDGINAKIDAISGGSAVVQQVIPIDTTQSYIRIKHGLNKKPVIKVLDDTGDQALARVIYVDDNTIEVVFDHTINGQVIIN